MDATLFYGIFTTTKYIITHFLDEDKNEFYFVLDNTFFIIMEMLLQLLNCCW